MTSPRMAAMVGQSLFNVPQEKSLGRILLVFRHTNFPLSAEVQEVLEKMNVCGEWYQEPRWNHAAQSIEMKWRRFRCDRPYCPECGPRWARKAASRTWKKLMAMCDGPPRHDEISWVTINSDELIPLGMDSRPAAEALKDKIRKTFERYLRGCALVAGVEFAVRPVEAEYFLMVHAHGWLWHPGITRAEIGDAFRDRFTEGWQVRVDPPRTNRNSLTKNVLKAAEYQFHPALFLNKSDVAGTDVAEVLHGLIFAYQCINSSGRKGLDLEVGVRQYVSRVVVNGFISYAKKPSIGDSGKPKPYGVKAVKNCSKGTVEHGVNSVEWGNKYMPILNTRSQRPVSRRPGRTSGETEGYQPRQAFIRDDLEIGPADWRAQPPLIRSRLTSD